MGSGKSSVGRLLARDLAWPRFDSDELVAAQLGMPIPRIFAELGEERFRAAESEVLARLESSPPAIVVTGGGAVLRSENIRQLQRLGTVVWLTADRQVLQERLARRTNRPLLQTPDPAATIAQLLAQREPLYASVAAFAIDTSARDHAGVAAAIYDELERRE